MTDGMPSTYELLAAEFEETFRDTRGGVELEYITGEQCISRLNQVLGPAGWSFAVQDHGINDDADEVWVKGRLDAMIDGAAVHREQFGSQKLKRSRKDRSIIDIGFDLKGAGTDALKKCAMGIGVGLYLSRKESQQRARAEAPPSCAECGRALEDVPAGDGKVLRWQKLAQRSAERFGRALCGEHYRKALATAEREDARGDAQASPEQAAPPVAATVTPPSADGADERVPSTVSGGKYPKSGTCADCDTTIGESSEFVYRGAKLTGRNVIRISVDKSGAIRCPQHYAAWREAREKEEKLAKARREQAAASEAAADDADVAEFLAGASAA